MNHSAVKCPWCKLRGEDVEMNVDMLNLEYNKDYRLRCPRCRATSMARDTKGELFEAATATPPNLPLTREQVEAMNDIDAVWTYDASWPYDNALVLICAAGWLKQGNRTGWLWFAHRPTAADIAAAKAGKDIG